MGICGGALRAFVAVVAAATAVVVLVVVVVAASAAAVRVAPVAVAVAAASVSVASATAAAATSALFEGVVLLLDVAEQVDAELFGALDFARVWAAGSLSALIDWC